MISETIDLYDYFAFAREGAKAGRLTAYRHGDMPEMRRKKIRPAILVIPGGGYAFVSQRESQPVALRYFAEGFDAFVLDYDVAPVSYPAQIVQAGMAMQYLRREAKNLDIDAEHIAAIGFSAGGHLLGCISLLWDDPALKALFGDDCERIRPDASVYSYAVISSGENISHGGSFQNFCGEKVKKEDYSLENKVRSAAAPSFIWSTTTDNCVPVENSVLLYSALHKAGVPAELHLFAEGCHGLSVCDIEVNDDEPQGAVYPHVKNWIQLSLEFLRAFGFAVRCIDR